MLSEYAVFDIKVSVSTGPTKHTVDDFWRMLWEQEVSIVVMVTKVYEGKKEKCVQYWPDSAFTKYGDIKVKVDEKQVLPDFTVMTLIAERVS